MWTEAPGRSWATRTPEDVFKRQVKKGTRIVHGATPGLRCTARNIILGPRHQRLEAAHSARDTPPRHRVSSKLSSSAALIFRWASTGPCTKRNGNDRRARSAQTASRGVLTPCWRYDVSSGGRIVRESAAGGAEGHLSSEIPRGPIRSIRSSTARADAEWLGVALGRTSGGGNGSSFRGEVRKPQQLGRRRAMR
jgi:hypothetical protein